MLSNFVFSRAIGYGLPFAALLAVSPLAAQALHTNTVALTANRIYSSQSGFSELRSMRPIGGL